MSEPQFDEFVTSAASNVRLEAIETETPSNLTHPRMYEWAVYLLGAVALGSVIGQVVLAALGREVPEALGNIALAAVVGLVGLLAPRAK